MTDVADRVDLVDTNVEEIPGAVRVQVSLPPETVQELRKIAEKRGVTLTQALRDAISLEGMVVEEVTENKAQILIRKAGQPTQELVVR